VDVAGYVSSLAVVFAVNIVAGYWRAHARERGRRLEWFLAVHAPVPLVALLRRLVGVGFQASDAALLAGFVAAYFSGQRVGGSLYRRMRSRLPGEPSRFLLRDVARLWLSS